MDLINISKSTPIEPFVNPDGWYCECVRCGHEVMPDEHVCPNCSQSQDWSWFWKK